MGAAKIYALAYDKVFLEDGAGSRIELTLDQGSIKYSIAAGKVSEVKVRGKRLPGAPTLVETEDGMTTGSGSFLIASYRSQSGAYTPAEFLQRKGRAGGLISTSNGGAFTTRIIVQKCDPETRAVQESIVFGFARITKLDDDPAGGDGKSLMSFEFEDYESEPQVIQGAV